MPAELEFSEEEVKKTLQGVIVLTQPQSLVDSQIEQYMPDPDLAVIARLICQDPDIAGALLGSR